MKDRFTKIAKNYGDLFDEVFQFMGFDYEKLEESVFKGVAENDPDFVNKTILDIGVGDGETTARFIEAGCGRITGIDLNPTMLSASRKRFGEKIKLIQEDATNLENFKPEDFSIIISGATIHNISKEERKKLWTGLLKLKPDLIVIMDKIADKDSIKHKKSYDNELEAINAIYQDKYGLKEEADAWVEHYKQDEKERLELEEIINNLEEIYSIKVVFEMGMNKAVVCRRK